MKLKAVLCRLVLQLWRTRRCAEREYLCNAVQVLDAAMEEVIQIARQRGAMK